MELSTQGHTGNNNINNNNNIIALLPSSPQPQPCRDLVDGAYTFMSPGSEPKITPFTSVSKGELKDRVRATVADLENFASDYGEKLKGVLATQNIEFLQQKSELENIQKEETSAFRARILPLVRDLHFELLRRLKLPWPVCSSSGLSIEGYKAITEGLIDEESGLINLAEYLKNLANRLP
jgi:hypothetical protein